MLSLQMPKSPLEIVVEIWLECLAVENSPEKVIYFQSATGPNLFWAVLSGQHFTISISQISSLTFAKSNQNSGLNLNRMLWPSWKQASRIMLLRFHLARSNGFLPACLAKWQAPLWWFKCINDWNVMQQTVCI